MPLFIFITATLITLLAEWSIYKKEVSRHKHKRRRIAYIAATATIWALTIIVLLCFTVFGFRSQAYMRVGEVVMLIYIFNGISKIIFAVISWIGRKLGFINIAHIIAGFLIVALSIIVTYSTTTGRWNIRTERREICSEKLPASFDGFRIVVFSDLHLGNTLNREQILTSMVDTINNLNADIIVNCGDLISYTHNDLDSAAISILSNIESQYGVFSALGNHDMSKYMLDAQISSEENTRLTIDKQKSMGWHVLRDASTPIINKNSDTIYISGIDFPKELLAPNKSSHRQLAKNQNYNETLSELAPDKFNIVISHAPQTWQQLKTTDKCDLTLSGHVHSLQMKVWFGEHCWSPARLLYKEWSGLYSDRNHYLYINDGIGYAMTPIRIWCKPEVTLIELRSNENNSIGGNNC